MGELSKKHRGKMAQHAECSGFSFHVRLKSEAIDHSARNEVEYLFENNYIGAGWCFVIHYPYRVAGISTQHQPIFTQCYGTPVKSNNKKFLSVD